MTHDLMKNTLTALGARVSLCIKIENGYLHEGHNLVSSLQVSHAFQRLDGRTYSIELYDIFDLPLCHADFSA